MVKGRNLKCVLMMPGDMKSILKTLFILLIAGVAVATEDPSWVEIDRQVYGAKPDSRGGIGGADGYQSMITRGDYTVQDVDGLVEALAKAQAGQVVFIPGETDMDLTSRIYIEQLVLKLPSGVTLAGNRGQAGSKGARLCSDALKTPVMIRTLGSHVRITGLRIQGPNPKRYLDHHGRAFQSGGLGREYYYRFPTSDGIRTEHCALEVDNCEISGFSHAGVFLVQGAGHRIHHNHIHHCQYKGLGYGVCHNIASSLIEHNRFNWNRHSIAGTGRPGSRYIARHNIEMGVSLSHCFDMHGGRDRQDGTDVAGSSIEISNNTFHAPQTPVVIRGVPEETCQVHHNWFTQLAQPSEAVRASGNTKVSNNGYGHEPVTVQ